MRETVELQTGDSAAAHSSPSALFGSPTAAGADLDWTNLPALRVDRADPSAAWLAGVSLRAGEQLLRVLEQAPAQTVEVQLAKARAAVDAGFFPQADALIDSILTENPWEWRAVWIAGLAALARADFGAAQTAFNTVLGQVPGELAPKLALAIACEKGGADDVAEFQGGQQRASGQDANYVAPAAFGLARTREKRGDIAASLNALDLVAPTSGAYVAARRRRAELLTGPGHGLADFAAAAASIENLAIDPRERQVALVAILTAALAEVRRNGEQPSTRVANVKATEPDLRAAAERAYRELAVLTSDRSLRIKLVDEANAVRPRTLV